MNESGTMVVGLTGQSGAGKSSLSRMFAARGVEVIDADRVARDAIEQSANCLMDLVLEFSTEVIHPDASLNRARLAELCFGDKNKLKRLNDITFPYIIEAIVHKLENAKARRLPMVVLDAPTLFESGLNRRCDRIIAVIADRDTRIERVIARDQISREDAELHTKEAVIVLADDLSPSETIQMDKSKILAIVTKHGSANSHTAILARSLNIPSLVNTEIDITKDYHGKGAVVDGVEGVLYIEPDAQTLSVKEKEQAKIQENAEKLRLLIGKENRTKDGRTINLYANMGNVEDVDKVLLNDAGGIGLFRSEFLYLGREDFPTEEEQFTAYKEVVSRMEGKKVIIRTLDIGADKKADYFGLDGEENPALGYRAIRICLTRPEIFKTQLRAIYRASAFGTVAIMFPMIISVEEIRKIKGIVEEVRTELQKEDISYGDVELGIMIETPAAALLSDELAKEVSFFSIGTNDLTQYTLAIDRQNQKLEPFYDSHHPAVLKLIEMTIQNGHKEGIWVGICGELAADDTLTETFLDMGLDELSVSPVYILQLREKIRSL